MKSLLYLTLACIALGGMLAPTAGAQDSSPAQTGRAIKANLKKSRTIIVELSDLATSPKDKKLIDDFVGAQRELERQHGLFVSKEAEWSAVIRKVTGQFNEYVRVFNQKCGRSQHPTCKKARQELATLRGAIKKGKEQRGKVRAFGTDLLKRTTRFAAALATILRNVKQAIEDSAPIEEITPDSASLAASASSGSVPTLSASSATGGLDDVKKSLAAALSETPRGLSTAGELEPVAEEPIEVEEPAKKSGWKRVRVRRRFGPFCWTQCCWRRVKADK